ncbi:MAG: hypothetical protein Q7S02_00180 [bacterium]|nr:hypothetical protein [bacterium]
MMLVLAAALASGCAATQEQTPAVSHDELPWWTGVQCARTPDGYLHAVGVSDLAVDIAHLDDADATFDAHRALTKCLARELGNSAVSEYLSGNLVANGQILDQYYSPKSGTEYVHIKIHLPLPSP